jgi:hypothetical protein
MGFEIFLRKHIFAGIGLLVGPAIAIGSLVLHAVALAELGLQIEYWVAIGLGIFFLSVVGILMTWDQEHSRLPIRETQSHPSSSRRVIPKTLQADAPPPVAAIVNLAKRQPFGLCSQPTDQPKDRIFVQREPLDLMSSLKDKMGNERERLNAPFLGKWICIWAYVDDISLYQDMNRIWVDGTKISLFFDKRWRENIDVLSKGQEIKVVGKIMKIYSNSLELEECEII